jgi:hypothetical protein
MTHHSGFRARVGTSVGMIAILMACPWDVRAEREAARAQASEAGSASMEPAAAEIGADTPVQAVLESKLDVRLLEVGDAVKARTSHALRSGERVVLPRGSKLLGRVSLVQAGSEASARSESRLGVSFDRAVLPDGQELAVDLAIQAIAAAEPELESPLSARGYALGTARVGASGARGSGGLFGGAFGDVIGDAPELNERIASDVAIDADAHRGRALDVDGALSTSSQGAIGLRGMQLDASGKTSVIVRSSGPIALPSGTRLLLRAKGGVSAH